MTGLIPVAATAMLVPCLAIIFGILSPSAAFLPFGSGILGLFVGVYLLVRAVQKFGLDRRIAFFVLRSRFATASPARLTIVAACWAWLLGMWMSNTATCALLLPVCLGIIDWSKAHLNDQQFKTFSTRPFPFYADPGHAFNAWEMISFFEMEATNKVRSQLRGREFPKKITVTFVEDNLFYAAAMTAMLDCPNINPFEATVKPDDVTNDLDWKV